MNYFYVLCFGVSSVICLNLMAETAPEAYLKLSSDILDSSGRNHSGENHGVAFDLSAPDGTPAARFNGRDAFLEAPGEIVPATGDFTLALWVYTEAALDDGLGDLLSNFDPDRRKGFTLGLATYGGVSNSQPNHRTVHFGLDDGTDPQWTFRGRPGKAVFVFGFAVHEGALYAATCEPGAGETGHVYRYDGDTAWADCGSPDGSNAVMALAVHDGRLYAGTGWYDTTGSALEASPNTTPGGKVFRYEGGTDWSFCGALANPETGEAGTMGGLGVYKGDLYATTLKQPGFGLYRYEGEAKWAYCGNPGRRVLNPCPFNGDLYLVSYDAPGGPFRYDGTDWSYVGGTIDPPIDQDYCFAVYGGRLHLSTWPKAYVYSMDEAGSWTPCGRPADELETMGMMVYNGKLYAGTLPSSRVYRLDGDNRWTPVGEPLDTAEGKYRRTWSMALYQGELFCGTLPSGNVFSMQTGACLTSDRALPPGWRHIAAVRRDRALALYIDGIRAAARVLPDGPAFDRAASTPLRIGAGPGDFFNGWMRNLRIYPQALPDSGIRALYETEKPTAPGANGAAADSHP